MNNERRLHLVDWAFRAVIVALVGLWMIVPPVARPEAAYSSGLVAIEGRN